MLKKILVGLSLLYPAAGFAQSVTISDGYVGTVGTSVRQLLSATSFATADVNRITFSQENPNGLFVETANGIVGTLTIYGTNGEFISIPANAQWQQKTGNTLDAVGFIPNTPVNTNLVSEPDLAFLVSNLIAQVTGRSAITVNGTAVTGSNDPVRAADLNALLLLQPAGITFAPTSTLAVDVRATEGGDTASFPVALTKAPTGNVTVTLSDPTGECDFPNDPMTLTFTPANWFTAQAVTVRAIDDQETEGNHSCTPVVTATSTDPAYNNLAALNEPVISITDNDGAGAIFGDLNNQNDLTASEGTAPDSNALLQVALQSPPAEGTTVTATLSDPTGQCSFSPATLDFTLATFATFQAVTVTAIDDSAVEGTHSCTPVVTFSGDDATYVNLGSVNAPSVTITDNDAAGVPQIQGPSGDPGDGVSEKIVDAGTTAVYTFTAEDDQGPVPGFWAIADFDANLFSIDRETGDLVFLVAPAYIPGGDNTYQVNVTFYYGISGSVTQLVTIRVRDTAEQALDRSRADIEQIIVDAEVAKLRGQQNSLRAMTSSARDRLAGGACGGSDDQQQSGGQADDQACRVDETSLNVDTNEGNLTISGSNNSVLTFDGYRRIVNLDLQLSDDNNVRTLSFNGHFALESFKSDNALYGVFGGVSLNKSDVSRGFAGTADSYGLSLGGYAVNEVATNVFSEAYLSIGRSQNQLTLTDGYLDVAADYGTVETNIGWILSGLVEKGDWDVLPEFGVQVSRSQSDSIDVVGTIPGDTASVTWDGLTASLARANVSSDFRYYINGRADDAWIVNFKPGIVCERVQAIAVTSDCGWTGGLGLNQQSSDGSRNFSAEATVEKVGTASRESLSVNYELRF